MDRRYRFSSKIHKILLESVAIYVEYLNNLFAREDIQAALVFQGIDPQEAQARIDSLSDAEVNDIVNKLDQLPAGGVLGTLLIIAFLVFVILLLTDITGYTDIFPFVKKK